MLNKASKNSMELWCRACAVNLILIHHGFTAPAAPAAGVDDPMVLLQELHVKFVQSFQMLSAKLAKSCRGQHVRIRMIVWDLKLQQCVGMGLNMYSASVAAYAQ